MQKIDRFENPKLIGEGISSSVYQAFDPTMGTPVAVKVLRPHLARDPVSIARFRREIELTRKLSQPNIIQIYDLIELENTLALSMELLKGQSLSEHIKVHGPLSWESFQIVFSQLLLALKYCHQRNIIHRDIKPQNIFVDNNLKTTLIDFGISRITALSDLTQTGTSLGTPEYMAPELYSSSFYDPRSDIYALGVVAYEMLAGQLPFQGETLYILFEKQTKSEAAPLGQFRKDIPPWMEKVIHKMMRKDIIDRYQTVSDVAHDFQKNEYFVGTQVDIHQQPCLKCQEDTPISFTVCLNCGFDPTNVTDSEKQLYSLYLSSNNRAESVAQFLKGFNFGKEISISQNKSVKLIEDLPSGLVAVFENHAKFHKVNLFALKQGFIEFIKQHLGFLGLGILLFSPYLAFVIFSLSEAARIGRSLYFAENAFYPSPSEMNWITLRSLRQGIESNLNFYLISPESLFPVLVVCVLAGVQIFYFWKLICLFPVPAIENWRTAFGAKSLAISNLAECLKKQAQLRLREHRKWGKKFLVQYLGALNKVPYNFDNHQTLFSLITASFEILSLMENMRQVIATTKPSDVESSSSLFELEEAYADAAVRLMNIDSLLSRISRNTTGEQQDLFSGQIKEAKVNMDEANLTLHALKSLSVDSRIVA